MCVNGSLFNILFPECLVYSVACYDTLELNLNKEKRHNYLKST